MGVLITLAVTIALMAAISRLAWPREARPPAWLYAGTIIVAFAAGIVAGSLADGHSPRRALEFALIAAPPIGVVGGIARSMVKAPEPPPSRQGGARPAADGDA